MAKKKTDGRVELKQNIDYKVITGDGMITIYALHKGADGKQKTVTSPYPIVMDKELPDGTILKRQPLTRKQAITYLLKSVFPIETADGKSK